MRETGPKEKTRPAMSRVFAVMFLNECLERVASERVGHQFATLLDLL
jgi:hypothetical protein